MKIHRTVFLSSLTILLWMGMASPAARASVIETYTYVGNDFTTCTVGCPANATSDYLNASFSFDISLVNAGYGQYKSDVVAWSVSDELGYFSASSSDPNSVLSGAIVTANSSGNFIATTDLYVVETGVGAAAIAIDYYNTYGDLIQINNTSPVFNANNLTNNAPASNLGVWTVEYTAPEPSTIELGLVGGVFLLMGMRRRKSAAAR